MPMQARADHVVNPFILGGQSLVREGQIIAQDAARVIPLAPLTLMAKVAATQLWTPLVNVAAANGTAIPQGVYMGDSIPAAAIVAGNVPSVAILVGGGCQVDGGQLVIENALTLQTVITTGANDLRTVRDRLESRGIFIEDTLAIAAQET